MAHRKRIGQPDDRWIVANKPKEEDYFYANPQDYLVIVNLIKMNGNVNSICLYVVDCFLLDSFGHILFDRQ